MTEVTESEAPTTSGRHRLQKTNTREQMPDLQGSPAQHVALNELPPERNSFKKKLKNLGKRRNSPTAYTAPTCSDQGPPQIPALANLENATADLGPSTNTDTHQQQPQFSGDPTHFQYNQPGTLNATDERQLPAYPPSIIRRKTPNGTQAQSATKALPAVPSTPSPTGGNDKYILSTPVTAHTYPSTSCQTTPQSHESTKAQAGTFLSDFDGRQECSDTSFKQVSGAHVKQ